MSVMMTHQPSRTVADVQCQKYLTYCAASFCAACGSVMALNSIDSKISVVHGIFITFMGTVFFASLAEVIQTYLCETHRGHRILKNYHLLRSDAGEITNKTVSAIQALLSSSAGAIVCNSSCRRSFLTASHFMSDGYAWFGAAYFIYDLWHMYRVHVCKVNDKILLTHADSTSICSVNTTESKNGNNNNGKSDENETIERNFSYKNEIIDCNRDIFTKRLRNVSDRHMNFIQFCLVNPVMIIHHVFLGSFGLFVIVYLRGKFGDCVYGFIYMMEISTPFVSIRGILSTFGMKDSKAYVINGILMMVTFFLCRIVMWPYLFYWYSQIANITFIQALISLPRSCQIGTLILFLPQVYWFYLIMRGALKIFLSKETPPETKSQ